MPFYDFNQNDIFYNRIETYPHVSIWSHKGIMYYNSVKQDSAGGNPYNTPDGHVNLYELNVNRSNPSQLIYPFLTKEGSLTSFSTVSTSQFNSDFNFGDKITGSYPLTAGMKFYYYAAGGPGTLQYKQKTRVNALQNTLNFYTKYSPHYAYSSGLGDKASQIVTMISIPSIFYGSSIKKGSVRLRTYVTGTLAGQLEDRYRNGELIQYSGSVSRDDGKVAGVVLYNEGFILLTGSWRISDHTERYLSGLGTTYGGTTDFINPSWQRFGLSGSLINSSSYHLEFEGKNFVPTITMMAHAPRGLLNHSNNPTFHVSSSLNNPTTGSNFYSEYEEIQIKNTVKSVHSASHATASFSKQTYISKIGIYDDERNLIAIGKLATPVKKDDDRELTFKLKLDI